MDLGSETEVSHQKRVLWAHLSLLALVKAKKTVWWVIIIIIYLLWKIVHTNCTYTN